MKHLTIFILGLAFSMTSSAQNIVVTIKPLHSIVQNILGDDLKAELVIDNNASPHDYQLKPSDLKLINSADIVFFIDESLESFMGKIYEGANKDEKFIPVLRQQGLNLLPPRSEEHNHNHNHGHNAVDAHIWLDVDNAVAIANITKNNLTQIYPESGELFEANYLRTREKLKQLDSYLKSQLEPLQTLAFITQHDAYQYFDKRYKLNYIRALALNASIPASLKLPQVMRENIETNDVKCIFSEPQYSNRIAKAIAADTNINIGQLDPIGQNLVPGKALYFDLLTDLADNFQKCLTQAS